MADKSVSILIPHYQTLDLTKLCLRLLRRETRFSGQYEVIVIDNGSTDGSGDVLREMRWLRVLRRETPVDERPAQSHGRALNYAIPHARHSRILIMHTDTMVLRGDWLDYLLDVMDDHGPECSIVGSWKMESPTPLQNIGKGIEEWVRRMMRRPIRKPRYIRSHCALYRRDALEVWPSLFEPSETQSAGEQLHDAIIASGRTCHFLSPIELNRYVLHLNHATMALNSQFGANDPYMPRTRARAIARIRHFFDQIGADELLIDESFDRAA